MENLIIRKLCSRWDPSLLTIEQIQRREVDSKSVGPPFYMWEKGEVRVVELEGRIGCMEVKENSLCWQGHALYFFRDMTRMTLMVIFKIEYTISRGSYANLLQKQFSFGKKGVC